MITTRFTSFSVILCLVVVLLVAGQARAVEPPTSEDDMPRVQAIKPLPYTNDALLTSKVRDTYAGDSLREIRFPIGGVGAGCIALNGKGALVDWEVGDRPNAQTRPDFTFIGLRIEEQGQTKPKFRVLEGRITEHLMGNGPAMFDGGGYGMGVRYSIPAGLPRYQEVTFVGRFPFAKVILTDQKFPVTAEVEGWSSFIPGNSDDSSLPVAVVNIKLTNTSDKKIAAKLAFSQQNLVGKDTQIETKDKLTRIIAGDEKLTTQMTYTVPAQAFGTTLRWHNAFWHGEGGFNYFIKDFVEQGKLPPSTKGEGGISTFAIAFDLEPGETKTVPYIITWYYPDRQGTQYHYAARFKSAVAVADYFLKCRFFAKIQIFFDNFQGEIGLSIR